MELCSLKKICRVGSTCSHLFLLPVAWETRGEPAVDCEVDYSLPKGTTGDLDTFLYECCFLFRSASNASWRLVRIGGGSAWRSHLPVTDDAFRVDDSLPRHRGTVKASIRLVGILWQMFQTDSHLSWSLRCFTLVVVPCEGWASAHGIPEDVRYAHMRSLFHRELPAPPYILPNTTWLLLLIEA